MAMKFEWIDQTHISDTKNRTHPNGWLAACLTEHGYIGAKKSYEPNVYISVLESIFPVLLEIDQKCLSRLLYLTLVQEVVNFKSDEVTDVLTDPAKDVQTMFKHLSEALTLLRESVMVYEKALPNKIEEFKMYEDDLVNLDQNVLYPHKLYRYTHLSDYTPVEDIMNDIYSYIRNQSEHKEPIDHNVLMKEWFQHFRNGGDFMENPMITPAQIKSCYDSVPLYKNLITLLYYDIEKILVSETNITLQMQNSQYGYTIDDLMHIYAGLKMCVEYMSIRVDAVLEFMEANNAVLFNTINAIDLNYAKNFVIVDDTEEMMDNNINTYTAELCLLADYLSVEESYALQESYGLMQIEEGLKETIDQYFEKVLTNAKNVLDKLNNIIAKDVKEKIGEHMDKLKSGNRPDPNFNIKNFTIYNLDAMADIKPVPFNFDNMREDLKSKDGFIQKYYPKLYDNEEKNLTKMMLKHCTVDKKDSIACNQDMISEFSNFCAGGWKKYTEYSEGFVTVLEQAKKAADTVAVSAPTEGQPTNQPNQAVTDAAIMTEAEDSPMAPTTSINRDQPKANDGMKFETEKKEDKREGNTELTKAVTMYCGITASLITACQRTLLTVWRDRLRIVRHYMMMNGWKKYKKYPQE